MNPTRVLASAAALLALALAGTPQAHEIPQRVVVHAYVNAEGVRLRTLVRVPLGAMRDIEFPQIGDGFLDVERAGPALRDAAKQWILPNIELFEAGQRLGSPSLVAVRVSLPSDRSFTTYDQALAHVSAGTLPDETRLPWPQALLDVLVEYPITS